MEEENNELIPASDLDFFESEEEQETAPPRGATLDDQVATLAAVYLKIKDLTERRSRRSAVLMMYMLQNNKLRPDPKTGKLRYVNDAAKVSYIAEARQRVYQPVSEVLAQSLREASSRQLHRLPPRDLLLAASSFSHTAIKAMVEGGRLSREEADVLYITKPEAKPLLKVVGPSGADFSLLDSEESEDYKPQAEVDPIVIQDVDHEIAYLMTLAREIAAHKEDKDKLRAELTESMLHLGLTEYKSGDGCVVSLVQFETGAEFHPPLVIKNQKKLSWATLARIIKLTSTGIKNVIKTKDLDQDDVDKYLVKDWTTKSAHLRFYSK